MSTEAVLLVHCFYQQQGGEDVAYADEAELLASQGLRVERLELRNDALQNIPGWQVAGRTIWNVAAARQVREAAQACGARIVHFHNTFPLLSPTVYAGARAAGASVVQTLHNYRLICPSALLLRAGKPCEKCIGRSVAWPAIQHACYRDDRAATTVVAAMIGMHAGLGTWRRHVDAYIALSHFARDKFVRGGLPPERVHVRVGYLAEDPGPGLHDRGYALFVGRLSEEKGIRVLLEAWRALPDDVPLKILGDGPLAGEVARAAESDPRIEWEGRVEHTRVLDAMRGAWALVLPSICYENAPRAAVEAAATGLPVIASAIGSIAEAVQDGRSGIHFRAGDADALAAAVGALWHDPLRWRSLVSGARMMYEREMSPRQAYNTLTDIYERALAAA